MKKINDYWVDKNNNKWDSLIFTEKEAKELSKTLINCSYCYNCRYCSYCYNCRYCSYSSNLNDCGYCSYCSNCSDFKTNPQRYYTPLIGSRNKQTKFYWTNDKMQITCGCFTADSIAVFEDRIKAVYGDGKSDIYFNQYINEIEIFKLIYRSRNERNKNKIWKCK